jgi:hypothetical protein
MTDVIRRSLFSGVIAHDTGDIKRPSAAREPFGSAGSRTRPKRSRPKPARNRCARRTVTRNSFATAAADLS